MLACWSSTAPRTASSTRSSRGMSSRLVRKGKGWFIREGGVSSHRAACISSGLCCSGFIRCFPFVKDECAPSCHQTVRRLVSRGRLLFQAAFRHPHSMDCCSFLYHQTLFSQECSVLRSLVSRWWVKRQIKREGRSTSCGASLSSIPSILEISTEYLSLMIEGIHHKSLSFCERTITA